MDKIFLENIFSNSKDKKIFIIGDIMLDRYLLGDVTRISPEAPVQVFDIRKSEYRLGGAANVGYNVKTLGSNPVLIGIIGDDSEGLLLKTEMKKLSLDTDVICLISEIPLSCFSISIVTSFSISEGETPTYTVEIKTYGIVIDGDDSFGMVTYEEIPASTIIRVNI